MGRNHLGQDTGSTIKLADGRRLGFGEYGDPQGWPLVFFHGTPGSRLMARFAAASAQEYGIRLLAPERPGYGLSDPQPQRRLLDWAQDLEQFADALNLQRFGLVGVSGGGPYVAACAWRLPARISIAGIISGLAPKEAVAGDLAWQHRLLALLVRRPWLTRPFLAGLAKALQRQPEKLLAIIIPLLPRQDRAIMSLPEVRHLQIDGIVQACRQGAQAVAQDLSLFCLPWGFPLQEIVVPVYLWHGVEDKVVPIAMGRCLAALIPSCQARFIPNAGHLWIFEGYKEVMQTLRNCRP